VATWLDTCEEWMLLNTDHSLLTWLLPHQKGWGGMQCGGEGQGRWLSVSDGVQPVYDTWP
jgi:hypothetical protein